MALIAFPTAAAQRSISPGITSIRSVSPSLCWLKIICSMDYAFLLLLLGLGLSFPEHFCYICVWPGWALGVTGAGGWKGKSQLSLCMWTTAWWTCREAKSIAPPLTALLKAEPVSHRLRARSQGPVSCGAVGMLRAAVEDSG